MQSHSVREASRACFHGCCQDPFLCFLEPPTSTPSHTSRVATPRYNLITATVSSLHPNSNFTNHESLPPLEESFYNFNRAFPEYSKTNRADQIRAQDYYHLSLSNRVCLDYIGHGLFSYSQQHSHYSTDVNGIASSSSSSVPRQHNSFNTPFFGILHKSVNLDSQILFGGEESEFESKIRKRIMGFMNISEEDYTMVFTANEQSAFKLLADSYPFQYNRKLLTVYDSKNEAVETIINSSKRKSARVMSAEFSWPNLRIHSQRLRKMVAGKKKRKGGLFVFPVQSRTTGARYSYQWMAIAQENGWHVCLDACALGAKDMETLGLSLFRPDFLVCSFFKVFGENPSGFACLLVKKSTTSVIWNNSSTNTGIVSLIPTTIPSELVKQSSVRSSSSGSISVWQRNEESSSELQESEAIGSKQKGLAFSEIVELDQTLGSPKFRNTEIITGDSGCSESECRGLDHADSLGLILISSRARYLVNWLVNALMSLQHPRSGNGLPLVIIHGPKINFGRGPAVAFNIFDWNGDKIDPKLVQKLADRNNISVGCGFLQNIWFSDINYEERERMLESRTGEDGAEGKKKREKFEVGVAVITATLGFLTNFEDVYRLWAFVSRFLDADFVEKERWRYMALNRTTVEV